MFVAALKLFASASAHNSPHFWASNAPFPTWAWGWPHFIPPLPKPFIRFHCCIFRCPHGLHVNSCIPNPPLPQFGPAAPGFLPVSPKGTKEFPHLTLLRNADRNRLRGNPFLGHTGTFSLCFPSCLPTQPSPWVTRKAQPDWELQFPGLEEKMPFAHTFYFCKSTSLQVVCSLVLCRKPLLHFCRPCAPLGLVARETPSPHYCSRAARAGLVLGTAGLPRNFETARSHLWSLIHCQSKHLLNQINSCSLLYIHGVFSTRGNCHLVLQINTVPPQQ